MEYVLFFSYAREDLAKNKKDQKDDIVFKFFDDLQEELRHKLTWKGGRIAFMDQHEITIGTDWRDEIRAALNSSRAFVYLHSPFFFASDYCGIEFAVFRQRVQSLSNNAESRQHRFIPVYWLPTPDIAGKVPEDIAAMQRASHAHGQKYNEFGLKKIVHQPKQYRQAVDVIAEHCRLAWNKAERLPAVDIAPLKTIKPAFPIRIGGNGGGPAAKPPRALPVGPRFARFLFVAASQEEIAGVRPNSDHYGTGGSAWIPYSAPEAASAGLIAQDAATRSHLERQDVQFALDAQHLKRVIEEAQTTNTPLAIVIDPWTLMLEDYWTVVSETIGSSQFGGVCTLFPWDGERDTTEQRDALIELLNGAFVMALEQIAVTHFDETIRSQEAMRIELENRLTKLKMMIINKIKVRKRVGGLPAPSALPVLSSV